MLRPKSARGINRRRFVGSLCAGIGTGALSQGVRQGWPAAAETVAADARPAATTPEPSPYLPAVPGAPFTEPPVLRSENGRLEVTLTAQRSATVIGGREVISMTYNGQAPAPTLVPRPGEVLAVTLIHQRARSANEPAHPRPARLTQRQQR